MKEKKKKICMTKIGLFFETDDFVLSFECVDKSCVKVAWWISLISGTSMKYNKDVLCIKEKLLQSSGQPAARFGQNRQSLFTLGWQERSLNRTFHSLESVRCTLSSVLIQLRTRYKRNSSNIFPWRLDGYTVSNITRVRLWFGFAFRKLHVFFAYFP